MSDVPDRSKTKGIGIVSRRLKKETATERLTSAGKTKGTRIVNVRAS